jgi:hypothetical protein
MSFIGHLDAGSIDKTPVARPRRNVEAGDDIGADDGMRFKVDQGDPYKGVKCKLAKANGFK